MKIFTLSRLYAASIIGLGVIGLAVACDQSTIDPPINTDDLATASDLTPVLDMTMFNPPMVTAVSPSNGPNNAATNITITGTDFRAGATVTVAGVACTGVIVVSSTSITCTVPGKAASCGPQDILVTHPDDGKMGLGAKLFSFRSLGGTSTFMAPVNYATGTGPRRVLAADFNADGKVDLVTANVTGNNVTVKTGLGDGTFPNGASQNLTVGAGQTGPSDLALGDFNADGKPDFVTVNSNGSITVFLNQGATAFTATVIATPGFTAGTTAAIAVGDITADNKLDIVLASSTSGTVQPLIGNGNGGFTMGTTRAVGGFVGDVALADMNKDGKLDIVTANASTNNVTICLSNGVGTFANPLNTNAGTAPSGLFITDLNGDKSPDLVVANTNSMNVSVLIGDGLGGLAAAVNQPLVTNKPESVWVMDFNGDKLPDIVTANSGTNNWSFLQGTTPTVYAAQVATNSGTAPTDITAADVNGDGLQDIIVTSNTTNNVQVSLQICK